MGNKGRTAPPARRKVMRGIKRAQSALAEAEAKANAILGSSPIGCVIVDSDARIIDCNDEMLKMLCVSEKSNLIDHYGSYMPEYQPDGRTSSEAVRENVRLALMGERLEFDWIYITETGERVPVRKTVARVEYGSKAIAISYNYDLRGVLRMQEEIAEAEDRARVIMDASPLASAIIDRNMRVIDCNEALTRTYDDMDKRFYMEHFYELSPEAQPDGRNSFQAAVEYIEKSLAGETQKFEWVHQKPGGELMPTEITLVPVKYRGENAVLCYYYDLRDIKKMQSEIFERDAQLRRQLEQQNLISEITQSFLSSTTKITALMDGALMRIGTFMGASRALIVMLNLTNGEVIIPYSWFGDELSRVPLRAPSGHIAIDAFAADLPEGQVTPALACSDVTLEENARFAGMAAVGARAFLWRPLYVNDRLWGLIAVEMCGAPREWSADEKQLLGAVGASVSGVIMRDIQSRERDAALDKAIAAGQAKGAFLSNMSHEMRTPMNAIIGMTVLGKNADGAARKDYALNKIEEASEHLLAVINDVLDMSKAESGKLVLSPSDFSFEKMTRRLFKDAAAMAKAKNQIFSAKVDPSIPLTLFGDEQRLSQVIMNLISNAVKFTPEGGEIWFDASLTGETDGGCELRFDVTDTGIGVSLGQQATLFQAFQQADTAAARQFSGTGLGLAISKRIVELMGGRIHVESELGKGASFIFTAHIPRGKGLAGGGGGKPAEGEAALSGANILLVEDVEINREIVMALFEKTGLGIDCASSGAEALGAFMAFPDKYDVIFMDAVMPDMDGFETARAIRAMKTERAAGIPIISMSVGVFEEDIKQCEEAGMNGCVAKPLDVEEVSARIREFRRPG